MQESQPTQTPATPTEPMPTPVEPVITPTATPTPENTPPVSPVPPVSPTPPAQSQPTDVLGIISLVCCLFGFQLPGVIVGAVGMRKAKKQGYNGMLSIIGFWLNLVMMVIIVLAIATLLVITTKSGVLLSAHDAERKADLSIIQLGLEKYYTTYKSYPALAQLQDDTWVKANLTELNTMSLQAPGGSANSISATASITTYEYVATPSGCTTAARNCTGYTLTANTEEVNTTPIVRTSLTD